MKMKKEQNEKISRSLTFKGIMIGVLALAMLIPTFMVQGLILERQQTRHEAIRKIDAKWSYAQIISGPILVIPYTTSFLVDNELTKTKEHTFNITPEDLRINTQLLPEERHYGIYKTILYKSSITMAGNFSALTTEMLPEGEIHWDRAYLTLGLSDLRGISENIQFNLNEKIFEVHSAGNHTRTGESLVVKADNIIPDTPLSFNCTMAIKGSTSISFLPVGRTTSVLVDGAWKSPGFIGNYTPEYTLDDNGFKSEWKVLHFNRNIPDNWVDNSVNLSEDTSFGVSLVDTVDIYQQNMRSAKYAFMFIALSFVVFFFVEVISHKRIHPIQYLLVGVALIIFYSLLLSFSEPIGFGPAYLIASVATISLITMYTSTIFKNKKLTSVLAFILSILYIFLYIILQLEDAALLAGSIGLFIMLGIIMYFSQKIKWYNEVE